MTWIDGRDKVVAYITRRCGDGLQLLAFEPQDLEEGLQVPAGGVDAGEEIVAALWREIEEESGLTDLALRGCLASYRVEWEDGWEVLHAFHLEAPPGLPDTWSHTVTAGEEDQGLVLLYRWLSLEEAASQLISGQAECVPLIEAPPSHGGRSVAASGDH